MTTIPLIAEGEALAEMLVLQRNNAAASYWAPA